MKRRTIALASLLLLAACGFSYWLGSRGSERDRDSSDETTASVWYCSMDPHITLPYPGKCSICGMDLIPLRSGIADAGPRAVKMTSTAIALAGIETATVERRAVDVRIRMSGKIDFDETKVMTVTARVPGRLDRLYVDYAGVPIAKGDHLADIYSPKLYEAQKQLLEALKTVEQSSSGTERTRRSSMATVDAVRKRLELLGLTAEQIADIEKRKTIEEHVLLNSTVDGVVIEKLANTGDYVETGASLYKVVSLDHLWVKLDAYESDLPWIRYGQKVSFRTEAYPGEEFEGVVTFIDWVVDDRTRTSKVRLIVNNRHARLKPGMFVRAEAHSSYAAAGSAMDPSLAGKWISPMHPEIVKGEPGICDVCGMDLVPAEKFFRAPGGSTKSESSSNVEAPLVIPASAPLLTGARAVVYVKSARAEGVFEGRKIKLGPRAGDHYVVVSGLSEGEEVVIRGNFKIDSALQILAKPSMMNPGKGSDGADEEIVRLAVPTSFRPVLDELFGAYLELSRALVETDLAKARSSFQRFEGALRAAVGSAAASLDESTAPAWSELEKALGTPVKVAGAAADIEALRKAFGEISVVMIRMARRFERGADAPLYEAFCPMAFDDVGAAWLQSTKEIRNPYFGDRMLKCGVVKGEIGP